MNSTPSNNISGNVLVRRALQVLADTTSATAILFDASGEVIAGPVAGSAFVRQLLVNETGRGAIIAAHRSAIDRNEYPSNLVHTGLLADGALDHFAIPVYRGAERSGTLTLGDRPQRALSAALIKKIAFAVGIQFDSLQEAGNQLRPWNRSDAAIARNLASLVSELLAELGAQEEDLRHRIEELTAVYNIAGMLTGTLDLQQILDKSARMVCEVMKMKSCSIRMLDESTGALTIQAVHNLSVKYIAKGPVTLEDNPIDRAAISGEMVRIADAPSDPRTRYPEQARKEGIVSGLVCGMIFRGKAVGVLRVYTGEPHVFTPFEESLLRAVASQAAAAIVNVRLLAETLEAERVARQLEYAGEVQRRMIPAHPPVHPKLDMGAVYRPTYNVGGDFYDFISLPKGNLGIGIADVSGKGVPASLLMASIRSAMRVYAYFMYDIDRILAEVNKHVCRETTAGEFATIFYGVITPDGKRLTYCNAGHDPPLLLRDGQITRLSAGGMVVGVDPDTTFDRDIVSLQSGDVLLLYTDGVVDALNFNDEPFGRERLIESFKRYADLGAQLVAQNMLWDLRRFRGLADRTDDVTLVVVKVK